MCFRVLDQETKGLRLCKSAQLECLLDREVEVLKVEAKNGSSFEVCLKRWPDKAMRLSSGVRPQARRADDRLSKMKKPNALMMLTTRGGQMGLEEMIG